MAARCAPRERRRFRATSAVSRSTAARSQRARLFFAIQGDDRDGHEFVQAALAKGAAAAVVDEAHARAYGRGRTALCGPGRAVALGDLAAAARARTRRQGRSASPARSARPAPRKALRLALAQGRRDPRIGRFLQQSLGRAAVAGALPGVRALRRVRNGHEPRRRNRAAVALVRPHVAIITTIAPVHLEFFGSLEGIADAKAEIFLGPRTGRRRDHQSRHRAIRAAEAPRQGSRRRPRIVSFRRACKAPTRA